MVRIRGGTSGSKWIFFPYSLGRSPRIFYNEAEFGDDLFEGSALASVAEALLGGVQGAAVFLCEFLVVVDHNFEQSADRAEFCGRMLIEQGEGLLEFLLEIECHEVLTIMPSHTRFEYSEFDFIVSHGGRGLVNWNGVRSRRGWGSSLRRWSRGWFWPGCQGSLAFAWPSRCRIACAEKRR